MALKRRPRAVREENECMPLEEILRVWNDAASCEWQFDIGREAPQKLRIANAMPQQRAKARALQGANKKSREQRAPNPNPAPAIRAPRVVSRVSSSSCCEEHC